MLPERQTFTPRECPKSGCPQPEIGKDGLGFLGFWTAAEVVYGLFCFVHTCCLLPNRIFAAEAWDLEVEVKISKACTVYKIHLSIVVVFGSDFQWPRRWSDASSWPNQRLPREMVGDPSVRASIAWVSWFRGYGIITCHSQENVVLPPTDNVLLDVVTPKLCAAQIQRFYIYNIL